MDTTELEVEMRAIGLIVENIILDDHIQRVPVEGKPHRKNGWYRGSVLPSGHITCTYGRWDPWEKITWNSRNGGTVSGDDRVFLEKLHHKHEAERIMKEESVRIEAKKMWDQVRTNGPHPYLDNKKLQSHPITKVDGTLLWIPMADVETGELVNIQRIDKDGSKRFLEGGQTKSTCFMLQGKGKVCISTGFATSLAIWQATGYNVVGCFYDSNLPMIAPFVKERCSEEIIVCGDNDKVDQRFGRGSGEHYGKQAAKLIGCQFIMPDKLGTDFNDLLIEGGAEAVREAIMLSPPADAVTEVLADPGITLEIPANLYKNVGLLTMGMQAAIEAGAPGIIQYTFPAVCCILSRAIASKLSCQEIYPNIYSIKVGRSSSGKTDVDRALYKGIRQVGIQNFYGSTDFASGPGLLRGLMENEICLIRMDEVINLFHRYKHDSISEGKMAALLELYTANGTEIYKPYSEQSKTVRLNNPVVSLSGNGTLEIFDDLRIEDMRSGMIQRFDFFTYEGLIPYRSMGNVNNPEMREFCSGIRALLETVPPQKHAHDVSGLIGKNYSLDMTDDCRHMLSEYSVRITDMANNLGEESEGGTGIIMSRYRTAIKYAMIHIAATRPAVNIFDPMEMYDLEWGVHVAEMLSNWKIQKLTGKITAGSFHKTCENIKQAIRTCMMSKSKKPRKPSWSVLCNIRKKLKNLTSRERDEALQLLSDNGDIVVRQVGKKVYYYLKKNSL